jgi:hypothetical protein
VRVIPGARAPFKDPHRCGDALRAVGGGREWGRRLLRALLFLFFALAVALAQPTSPLLPYLSNHTRTDSAFSPSAPSIGMGAARAAKEASSRPRRMSQYA